MGRIRVELIWIDTPTLRPFASKNEGNGLNENNYFGIKLISFPYFGVLGKRINYLEV